MGRIIGIDLGTTNSCVAVLEGRAADGTWDVKVIPNAEGARTTPSVVGFATSGDRLVGQVAKRQTTTNPEHTVHAVKRLMGRKFREPEVTKHAECVAYRVVEHDNGDAWVLAREQRLSPQEVSAMVLQSIKETAERFLGTQVTEAIVTVPAYFDDAQRQATKDAGRIAGLTIERILNEPTAAALAYGLDKRGSSRIAVYDLGGGTFDISLLDINNGVFSVKATGGDTHLGGEDFDRRIVDALAEEFLKQHGVDLRLDRMALQRLREAAERSKHELSSALETEVNLPFITSNKSGPLHLERTIKRSELEILTMDLIQRTVDTCEAVLQQAGLVPAEVTDVVLVGGMTRMPAVQRAVKILFGRDPHRGVNPDEAVAVGAAIQGAAITGTIDEVLLLDVTPLSIGVETAGGVFTKLIERNTTIPTERSEIFTTSVDNQNFVPVHVVQGEREMAADNRSLARLELTGIPPAPRGLPKIQVTFGVDADGILSVEARDLGTGRKQAVQVRPSTGLTEREVNELIAAGDRFKEADTLRRELAELKNQAETLIFTSGQAVDGYGGLVAEDTLSTIREDIDVLKRCLESGELSSIRVAYANLEGSTFALAEAMYGSAQQ